MQLKRFFFTILFFVFILHCLKRGRAAERKKKTIQERLEIKLRVSECALYAPDAR